MQNLCPYNTHKIYKGKNHTEETKESLSSLIIHKF